MSQLDEVVRSDRWNTASTPKPASAFTPLIATWDANSQPDCVFFTQLPGEVRVKIFEYACASVDDHELPFQNDKVYYRPDLQHRQKADVSLLLTCKRVYLEARVMPVSEAVHTFWMFNGPLRLLRVRTHGVGDFKTWQSSLNEPQVAAVKHVHLFAQQYYLEQMGTRNMVSQLQFKAKYFKLTLRHSDFWSWESPAESNDRLGICPWLPNRVSQQAMLSQPVEPTIEDLFATMIKGTWGYQIGLIEGLEVFRIEFETDILKKAQLQTVIERARYWKFPTDSGRAVLESDGVFTESTWVGAAYLKQDNAPNLRRTGRTRAQQRTYYVIEMAWKKRILRPEEMA